MTNGHQLRLYNSLGRRVEDFVPSGDVTGMYSCGPTVYAYQHLGNMRAYVFADTERRALRWKGVRVRHVVNITDVEQRRSADDLTPEERHAIEQLVADRTQARKERDWARADQIRAELDNLGVQLTDTPEGPAWHLR